MYGLSLTKFKAENVNPHLATIAAVLAVICGRRENRILKTLKNLMKPRGEGLVEQTGQTSISLDSSSVSKTSQKSINKKV